MIEFVFSFPNWGTALVVITGAITIQSVILIGVYNIGRTSKEKD